eukprot:1159711-Pelagomonas_calceolata.AAC.6
MQIVMSGLETSGTWCYHAEGKHACYHAHKPQPSFWLQASTSSLGDTGSVNLKTQLASSLQHFLDHFSCGHHHHYQRELHPTLQVLNVTSTSALVPTSSSATVPRRPSGRLICSPLGVTSSTMPHMRMPTTSFCKEKGAYAYSTCLLFQVQHMQVAHSCCSKAEHPNECWYVSEELSMSIKKLCKGAPMQARVQLQHAC